MEMPRIVDSPETRSTPDDRKIRYVMLSRTCGKQTHAKPKRPGAGAPGLF
jgi:hypothetical protein